MPFLELLNQIREALDFPVEGDTNIIVGAVGAGGNANNGDVLVEYADRRGKLYAQTNALLQCQFAFRLVENADEHAADTDVQEYSPQWRILLAGVQRGCGRGA